MATAREYLTLQEMFEQARELGLDISQRTLKFYTTRGLLPKPEKAPFPDADGRVSYYHKDVVRRLRRIAQLKSQGLTLEQIKKVLEQKGSEPLRQLTTPEDDWRRQVSYRFLQHFQGEDARRARLEFLASVLGTDGEELLHRAARRYLARLLTPLVGETEAHRLVEEFFLGLPAREVQRRMETFRRWRDQEKERERTQQELPFFRLRRMTGDLILGLLDPEEYLGELEDVAEGLEALQGRLHLLSAGEYRDELLMGMLREAFAQLGAALQELRGAGPARETAGLARGLGYFQHGSEQLGRVAELARRYQEALQARPGPAGAA